MWRGKKQKEKGLREGKKVKEKERIKKVKDCEDDG